MFETHKESGPEGACLADASGGGEGHAGEGEGQDHGPQTHVTQAQVEQQASAPLPPPRHPPPAVRPASGPRRQAAGVWWGGHGSGLRTSPGVLVRCPLEMWSQLPGSWRRVMLYVHTRPDRTGFARNLSAEKLSHNHRQPYRWPLEWY